MSRPVAVLELAPSAADLETLAAGIEAHSAQVVGPSDRRDLTLLIRNDDGCVAGGLHGNTGGTWLYVGALWVDGAWRGQGLGRDLLLGAEAEAVRRGCRHAYLDTFSFQAPGFYARLGYAAFAELADVPAPHRRLFFRKALGPA